MHTGSHDIKLQNRFFALLDFGEASTDPSIPIWADMVEKENDWIKDILPYDMN